MKAKRKSHWVQLTKYLDKDYLKWFLVIFKKRKLFKKYRTKRQPKKGSMKSAIFVHDSEIDRQ